MQHWPHLPPLPLKNRLVLGALALTLLGTGATSRADQAPATGAAAGAAETVAPAPAVPTVPLGVAMTANSPDSVTLTWYRSASNDITGYNVYASPTKDGTYTRIATVKERTATHRPLPPDTTHFYRISAINAQGEGPQSPPTMGFSFKPTTGAPFPVKIAKNMCVTLGATMLSEPAPSLGELADLVDGSDATSAGITGPCEVKIKLNDSVPIDDAPYLLLNFRTDQTGQGYAYNINWRSLKSYVISESLDSTDGKDGTWTEVVTGENKYLDGVVLIPNHKPKWISIKNSNGFQLCRLELFRAAPAGYRNDYWIFTGDSLMVQDMMGGSPERHTVWFSDLVRKQHPDRYPIVVNSSQGGEMMSNTLGRMKNFLPVLSPPNGTGSATATIVCFEPGFNDVGVASGLWTGQKLSKMLAEAKKVCEENGTFLVPVRIQYATTYLNPDTLEPNKYNIFFNTLAANLGGLDGFCRDNTPYATDPQTQLPYADYWNYTRQNYATALAKDGVHHTKAGSDGINTLWAQVADKMIYSKQK